MVVLKSIKYDFVEESSRDEGPVWENAPDPKRAWGVIRTMDEEEQRIWAETIETMYIYLSDFYKYLWLETIYYLSRY